MTDGYFIVVEGKVKGPFEVGQLQELLNTGAIGRETPLGPGKDGPFDRLEIAAVPGLSLDAAPGYAVANRKSAPIDHRDLIAAANAGRSGADPGRPVQTAREPARDSDIHQLLELNKAKEAQSGVGDLKPIQKYPKRRNRDFAILSIAWVAIVAGFVGRPTPAIALFEFAMIAFFVAALWWVMFHVMDKY